MRASPFNDGSGRNRRLFNCQLANDCCQPLADPPASVRPYDWIDSWRNRR